MSDDAYPILPEGDDMPKHCPGCGESLIGMEIPPELREHYGGQTHYTRVIGLYDTDKDRTVTWACPDCGHRWPRELQ